MGYNIKQNKTLIVNNDCSLGKRREKTLKPSNPQTLKPSNPQTLKRETENKLFMKKEEAKLLSMGLSLLVPQHNLLKKKENRKESQMSQWIFRDIGLEDLAVFSFKSSKERREHL